MAPRTRGMKRGRESTDSDAAAPQSAELPEPTKVTMRKPPAKRPAKAVDEEESGRAKKKVAKGPIDIIDISSDDEAEAQQKTSESSAATRHSKEVATERKPALAVKKTNKDKANNEKKLGKIQSKQAGSQESSQIKQAPKTRTSTAPQKAVEKAQSSTESTKSVETVTVPQSITAPESSASTDHPKAYLNSSIRNSALLDSEIIRMERNRSPGRFTTPAIKSRSIRYHQRSRSAEFKYDLPASRLVEDNIQFKLAQIKANALREKVTIDHVSPTSNYSMQMKVARLSKQKLSFFKALREERSKEVATGELTDRETILAREEDYLLNGYYEDDSDRPRLARIEKRSFPELDDHPFFYPGIAKRFNDEMRFAVAHLKRTLNLRELHETLESGKSKRPLSLFDNFENMMETIDYKNAIDFRSGEPRNPIKLCTRTPCSSPDRRAEMREHWQKELNTKEELPFPSLNHPDAVQLNDEATLYLNDAHFHELHDGIAKKITDRLNADRRTANLAPVPAKIRVAWPPKQRYDLSWTNIPHGRQWSMLPAWFPRDIEKIHEMILSMVPWGSLLDYQLRNIFQKEEDYLAKLMVLVGSNAPALRHTLQVRFAFQKWEYETNKERTARGEPLEYLLPREPFGTLCEAEFNRQFGKVDDSHMNELWHYHPVLVIDVNKDSGSYLRLSRTRYPEPLPRGAVRVVVPLMERGEDSEFEPYCTTHLSIKDFSTRAFLSVGQYHPINVNYKANVDRCYRVALPFETFEKLWNDALKNFDTFPDQFHTFNEEQIRELKLWPYCRREFAIWFEAMVRQWKKSRGQTPFAIRHASRSDRDEFLRTEHPDLYEKVLTIRRANETKTAQEKEKREMREREKAARAAAAALLSPQVATTTPKPSTGSAAPTPGPRTNEIPSSLAKGGAITMRKKAIAQAAKNGGTPATQNKAGAGLSTPLNTKRPLAGVTSSNLKEMETPKQWVFVYEGLDDPNPMQMTVEKYDEKVKVALRVGAEAPLAYPYTPELDRIFKKIDFDRTREDLDAIKAATPYTSRVITENLPIFDYQTPSRPRPVPTTTPKTLTTSTSSNDPAASTPKAAPALRPRRKL